MEFFDNAVTKAKEVLDVACKKTEAAVTAGKQKFDVAAVESKLEKDYARLGRIYYETIKNSDDIKGETLRLKEAVDAKRARIKEIKEEINKAKNRRECPNCGALVDKDDLFCNNCGAKLEYNPEEG